MKKCVFIENILLPTSQRKTKRKRKSLKSIQLNNSKEYSMTKKNINILLNAYRKHIIIYSNKFLETNGSSRRCIKKMVCALIENMQLHENGKILSWAQLIEEIENR